MPIPTPFHERTAKLCTSMRWKEWAGYYAVCSYELSYEREYFAYRHSAGMIDVTPLYKYEVHGPDAGRFLARVMSKDPRKLDLNQVSYLCWCDDQGKVVDDGTVTRLEENRYRVTAAEPSLSWFGKFARGFQFEIEDVTDRLAALALQGPHSRAILASAAGGEVNALRFFRGMRAKIDGAEVFITRTGYSGDLGFEVWTKNENALKIWDALMSHGRPFGIEPAALDAYDVSRIEAGFIMNGVDYFSANHCAIDSRKSTPYEIGLGWTLQLERDPFVGQRALLEEKKRGPEWSFVGLEIDWDELEAIFGEYELPPQLPHGAWRTPVPIYLSGDEQVGYASSGTWSPTLKKNLALASIRTPHAAIGSKLKIEWTAEFQRRKVTATVSKLPFFDPPRKRSTPNGR